MLVGLCAKEFLYGIWFRYWWHTLAYTTEVIGVNKIFDEIDISLIMH